MLYLTNLPPSQVYPFKISGFGAYMKNERSDETFQNLRKDMK